MEIGGGPQPVVVENLEGPTHRDIWSHIATTAEPGYQGELWSTVASFAASRQDRWAPSTLDRCLHEVRLFAIFLIARGDGVHAQRSYLRGVDRHVLRDHLAGRSDRPHMRGVALRALRGFFKWAKRSGAVEVDPTLELLSPRLPEAFPALVGEDIVARILAAPSAGTLIGIRDRAVLETLYGTGATAKELVALDMDHLDLQLWKRAGAVELAGRSVPVGRAGVHALGRYLLARKELAPRDRALFIRRGGARLGGVGVRRLVRAYGLLGAGRGDVTPRVIRNSFAAHMLDRGADLRVVQILMGHRTVKSTVRYLQVAMGGLIKVYRASHPLARRKAQAGA